ncbi:MAG: NUDIX hydrolase [Nanoarchaeota archaeon]|nr:NUDIX hydrolase [Nanoarchaeota archaeon]
MYKDRKGNFHKKPSNIKAKNRESAYAIYIKNNKILMIKNNWNNTWEFPGGGKINSNENINSTLKREFFEETNLEINNYENKAIYTYKTKFYADDINEFFNSKLNFYIIQETKNNDIKINDIKEIKDIKFIEIKKLNNENTNKLHLEILNKLIKKEKSL